MKIIEEMIFRNGVLLYLLLLLITTCTCNEMKMNYPEKSEMINLIFRTFGKVKGHPEPNGTSPTLSSDYSRLFRIQ